MPSVESNSKLSSWTDKVTQLLNLLKFERRNAVKYKVSHILDHKFQVILLKEPTYCSQCGDLIWGLNGQSCKSCKLISHKRCLKEIDCRCVTKISSESREHLHESHKFVENYFLMPTCCDHCGILLKGVFESQGLKCDINTGGCGMSIHRECKLLIGRACGVSMTKNKLVPGYIQRCSRICIEDFQLIRFVDGGTFGKVYVAKLRQTGQEFALKVVNKTTQQITSDPESVFTEQRVLRFGRQHPFLLITHCCFHNEARLFFVLENIRGKNLFFHLSEAEKFSEDRTRFYAAEIVLALIFLHKQGVVCRDVKPESIIIDPEGHCKLLDFGLTKELSKSESLRTRTFCGTPIYISPEVISEYEYGFSVDWWALGVLIYEMLIGHPPFDAKSEPELYHKIKTDSARYPKYLSSDAKSILEGLLMKDSRSRLGCNIETGYEQAILDHRFFLFDVDQRNGVKSHQWDSIKAKKVKVPFIPRYTEEEEEEEELIERPIQLSPVVSNQLLDVPQEEFENFSFYSSSFEINHL